MLFCLKHLLALLLICIFIPEGDRIVLPPWKSGAGAPGGRVGNPYLNSAAVMAGHGGCHLITLCLLYVVPPQILHLTHHHRGAGLVSQHLSGPSVPAAASWLQKTAVLQGEEKKRMVIVWMCPDADAPALFPLGVKWMKGTDPTREDAPVA